MKKKSIVLLLSLALLIVSGSLFAAGGQRGAWVVDETQHMEWTPRWMSEEINADQRQDPRGYASDQYRAAESSLDYRMGRGQTFASQSADESAPRSARSSADTPRSARFTDDTRRAYGSNRMGKQSGPSRQGSESLYGERTSLQRQLRTPADDCCYLETSERQYQNQDDKVSYGRNGTSTRSGMMR
ncbi:MAG: hypothetical protein JXK93_02820 [Sphaerochaetaceae bacterium]|nr:hypothetical protein [Sphaerochaetaceae bacterium]